MAPQQSRARFVLSGQQQLAVATAGQQDPSTFTFAVTVRLGTGNLWDPPASADTLMKQLFSDQDEEPQGARRGHGDEWYQQRCVFCADCKVTVNSQYQKRGSRCQGCRRWYHATCMPATARGNAPKSAAAEAEAAAAVAAGDAMSSEQQQDDTASGSQQHSHSSRRHHNMFFHSSECQQLYEQLSKVAAAGQQPFTVPPPPTPFWQQLWQPKQPEQQQCWRLLDLAEVRHFYRDAQKRGTLFRQHKKVQRQLEATAEAAEERASSTKAGPNSSSSSKGAEGSEAAANGSAVSRSVLPTTSLEDFLVVAELLKPLGENPRDLLEDSYAIISRQGRDGPSCVATFNVYGHDHARLQGVVTPSYLQHKGHATRLLGQLQEVLGDVGLRDMVVIIEPEVEDSRKKKPGVLGSDAARRWFTHRLGFRAASSEQQMLWRRELPEYHKGLIVGCSLLVKPLSGAAKGKSRL